MKLFLVCVIVPVVMAQNCPPAPMDPITCKDNELTCGGEVGPDGCIVPTWCKYIDPYGRCSSRAFCETECGPDMMKCAGGVDDDDCPRPDTCVPSKTTDDCPAECPVVCAKNEILCDVGKVCVKNEIPCDVGREGKNGCPYKGICLPIDPTSKCPAECGVSCNWGDVEEMYCEGPIDASGCQTDGSCIPTKPTDGKCRNFCPVHCQEGQMFCPGGLDDYGCPVPDRCQWVNPNDPCSSRPYCYEQENCGPGHLSCYGGKDDDGCRLPDTCIPYDNYDPDTHTLTTNDGCQVECPLLCGKDEMMCGTGVDENGCPTKGSCMHYDATAICKDACPVQCGTDDMVCPGGMDTMGCKMPDICIPSKGKSLICFREIQKDF